MAFRPRLATGLALSGMFWGAMGATVAPKIYSLETAAMPIIPIVRAVAAVFSDLPETLSLPEFVGFPGKER